MKIIKAISIVVLLLIVAGVIFYLSPSSEHTPQKQVPTTQKKDDPVPAGNSVSAPTTVSSKQDSSWKFKLRKVKWSPGKRVLSGKINGKAGATIELSSPNNPDTILATLTVDQEGSVNFRVSVPDTVPCELMARIAGTETTVINEVKRAPTDCD